MINTLFQKASRPVYSRVKALEEIRAQERLIPHSRIATTIDLEDCFFDNGIHPRGCIGSSHLLKHDKLQEIMQKSVNSGMFLQDIPAALAKEKTQDLIRSRAVWRLAAQGFESEDPEEIEIAIKKEIDKESGRLQLLYVGDYLHHIETHQSPRLSAAMDILAGKANAVLRIIKSLQDLPDYSEYADSDRKPPMKRKEQSDRNQSRSPSWRPAFNI